MDGGSHAWRSEPTRWSGTVATQVGSNGLQAEEGVNGSDSPSASSSSSCDGEVKRNCGWDKSRPYSTHNRGDQTSPDSSERQKNDTRIMRQVREIQNLHPVQSVSLAVPGEIAQTSPWNNPSHRRLTTAHPSDFVSFCAAAAACRIATPRQLEGTLGHKCQRAQSLQSLISPGPCMQRQQLRTVTASDDRI